MSPARAVGPLGTSLATIIILILIVPFLVFSSLGVRSAAIRADDYERSVRNAQSSRARLLRYQLDEETGLRGFTSTADRHFLQPYERARANWSSTFAAVAAALTDLHLPVSSMQALHEEQRINEQWNALVAVPLEASPRRPDARALQERGKVLIDEFRAQDADLQVALDDAAQRADERNREAITRIVQYTIAVGLAVVLVSLYLGYMQQRAARRIRAAEVKYQNEKLIADALQDAYIQKSLPDIARIGFDATYIPAAAQSQVGGDWYDAFELPDGRVLFSIGDVAGHGIEAAVVMGRARQAILTSALQESDPALVLARANASLTMQDLRMVTAVCGYIDTTNLEVVYATAGHPAPIFVRRGAPGETLPSAGIPLGILSDATYQSFHVRAARGDIMVLYTDGIIEHERDVIAGVAALLEAARGASTHATPASAIRDAILKGGSPRDDVAILTIAFDADGADT